MKRPNRTTGSPLRANQASARSRILVGEQNVFSDPIHQRADRRNSR